MRWRPRIEQPTLTEEFRPVIANPVKRPVSRFVAPPPKPKPSESERLMREQVWADQAAETAAYLEEKRLWWETEKKRRGL